MKNGSSVSSGGKRLTGVFYDSPVQGLEYNTQTISGITDENSRFHYIEGETVTFSLGGLIMGSALGKSMVTPADLIIETGGDIRKIKNPRVTNIARFLQSLDSGGDIESRIVISDETRDAVKKYRYRIDFNQMDEAFEEDPAVRELFDELEVALRSSAQAMNHLRRTLMGIKKMTDVKIPMRDGSYLLADIYSPINEGKYPVVMSLGIFGKAFQSGCICCEEDLQEKEKLEEKYFEGCMDPSPMDGSPVVWENHETPNSADWVPRGYAVMRVDARGIGNTPGTEEMFSLQEAKDFYDSIEWAASQPWCNGNVGIFGTGYYGMVAWNVAQLQPPSLKAMIPIAADSNSYRDYIFTGGGLWNTFGGVGKNCCGEWQAVDWKKIAMENPFDEPEIYGPEGKICIGPDLCKVQVPLWSGMGLSATIHTRGASEGFILSSSKHKKLTIISETGIHMWAYNREFFEKYVAFFDHWLKNKDNNIMDEPPVQMMVRTGMGGFFWQDEDEWPIARTQYVRYYLDSVGAAWEGDGRRNDYFRMETEVPQTEQTATYSAGVEWEKDNNWSHGISFVTEPFDVETLIAGYMKLVIWVSSTTYDMELHTSVRVIDENNMEVSYPLGIFDATTTKLFPVTFGGLKVSHRKLDPQKSTIYRPWHTHRRKDHQPLIPGEAVETEVELWPTTALVRKGWRLKLDIQPVSGDGLGMRIYDALDQGYQKDSQNTVYTGPDHPSYLQIPVVPPKV